MAELLVRYAKAEDQDEILAESASRTYRAMQAWLTQRRRERRTEVSPFASLAEAAEGGAQGCTASLKDEPRWSRCSLDATGQGSEGSAAELESHEPSPGNDEDLVRPARSVRPHELLMVEASRMLVEHLNGSRPGDEGLVVALLGEAETSLQDWAESRGERIELSAEAARSLESRLREGNASVEADSSAHARGPALEVEVADESPLPESPRAIDEEICDLSRRLARAQLRMGELAATVFAHRAWRVLGYSTADAYVRERIGVSRSTLEHRMTLARRCRRHPALTVALEAGTIGYEAALLIGRVLGREESPELVRAWIERAGRRTVLHLREEVEAVLLSVGIDPGASRTPPTDEQLSEVAELERRVQSGDLFRSLLGTSNGPQMSVTLRAMGRDAAGTRMLRLTIPSELYAHWLRLEGEFHHLAGPEASFVGFMCMSLWSAWLPYLEAWDDKWKEIYRRDRHRCTSPVCGRHDVTPHHLVFQSHGGGHDPSNVASLCAWCHLFGIHEGRLKAEPPAGRIRWTIGRDPVMVVDGRERSLVA